MIRINLLPFRLARKKENIRRQVSVFLLSVLFFILLMAWYALDIGRQVEKTRAEVDGVKAEIQLYKEKADQVTEIKKKLDRLKEKLAVVDSLQNQRHAQQMLLEELADRLIKDRMWLVSLDVKDTRVTMNGVAFDNPTIADFMRSLEKSPLFASVDLSRSESKVFGDNVVLKKFELVCTKKTGKPKSVPAKKGK